jgi:4-carboxymuconolactone decarboxylase
MATHPKFDTFRKEIFEEGLKMRRSVLGEEYVD